jgi:hypothetical protein
MASFSHFWFYNLVDVSPIMGKLSKLYLQSIYEDTFHSQRKHYRRGCIRVTGVHSSTDIDSVLETSSYRQWSLTETSCKVISFRNELLRYKAIPQTFRQILFYLYFQFDILFSSVCIQCLGFLFPLHVSGLTDPSSGGLNCTCSQKEFFLNSHTTKTPAEGESTTGCMYNLDLLMMGLWGLKHVEEKENADTVYRSKRIVYQFKNKDKINYTEMHGQQNIKTFRQNTSFKT